MERSERLAIIRFPMILLILYIHSFVGPVYLASQSIVVEPPLWIRAMEMFLSDGIARTAVPVFYLIAGYLYFQTFDGSWGSYFEKSKRRIFTLLIPYLLWNGIVLALFLVGESLPQTATLFNPANGRMINRSIWELLDILLGVSHYPIAYQFWFIRDLMLMVTVTPLLRWLLRQLPGILECILVSAWLSTVIEFPVLSLEGLTFFVLGASFGMRRRSLFIGDGQLKWMLPALIIGEMFNVWLRLEFNIQWAHRPVILIGIVVFLTLTKSVMANGSLMATLKMLGGISFFIFAAHEPLMTMLRKLIYRTVEVNEGTIFAIYTLLPLLVAALTLAGYAVLRRTLPLVASLLDGQREGSSTFTVNANNVGSSD